MDIKRAFAQALVSQRKIRGCTQEDFTEVTSRSYMSELERGNKCPTLEKVEALASVLRMHPLALLVSSYMQKDDLDLEAILSLVTEELSEIGQ